MTQPLHRRLDAIASAFPSGQIDRLEALAARIEATHRISSWRAGPEDFEHHFAPSLEEARQDLIAAAVKHRVSRWNGLFLRGEGGPDQLAAAAVDFEPASPQKIATLEALGRYAEPPSEAFREGHDPLESSWLKANGHLVTLGADRGDALHQEAAPAFEAARDGWLIERAKLAQAIAEGTARRVVFYVWVLPDLDERRDRLLAQALARRSRRADGEMVGIQDLQDAAADIVSYLPSEPLSDEPPWILRIARDQRVSPGTPAHEEWVEANELHWVVGPDGGTAMRKRFEAMVEEGESDNT